MSVKITLANGEVRSYDDDPDGESYSYRLDQSGVLIVVRGRNFNGPIEVAYSPTGWHEVSGDPMSHTV